MKHLSRFVLLISILSLNAGCSSKMWTVAGVGLASGALGAGVGYAFVHHGSHKEYQTTNTIITASLFAAIGAGVTYWHLTTLEDQRVELAGKFSRSTYLERDVQRASGGLTLPGIVSGKRSIRLDDTTRWVFPEFQKRDLPPQRGETELISSHYSWEIARPGFFITREQDPSFFKDEEPNDSHK